MADVSEVLTTIAELISNILYPDGVDAPCVVAGVDVVVYPGWPVPDQLDLDMEAGNVAHISVFPRLSEERNTTKHPKGWQTLSNNGTTGVSIKEVRRQEQVIQIIIWAATPAQRDAICKIVDPRLADTPRITLPDQTIGMMVYRNSLMMDTIQKHNIYRRDLFYTVEYGTTITSNDYTIKQNDISIEVMLPLP